ncbi:MAG: response regulator [Desulfuromonadales bacterium]
MDKRFRILAVDDEYVNTQLLKSALGEEYDILTVLNGHEAIDQIEQYMPDLILMDVMMPDITGFEVCKIIKADERFADIPVIFLTALDSQNDQLHGLELGGIDYLTKPVNFDLLKLRVRNHLAMKEQRDLLVQQKEELDEMLAEQELQNEQLREADETLLEAEWKFKALFDNGPIGVAYHSMIYDDSGKAVDYRFIDANGKYIELTGVDPRGKTVLQAFPGIENDPFDWIGTFGAVAKTGESIRFEQYLQPNDRWYDVVGYQYKPDHFVAAFFEITERKRAEEALQACESRWKFALEGAGDGVWDWNIQTGEAFYSQCYKEMLGGCSW